MTKVQKIEQTPQRSPEELAKLRERQRKQQENIDWLNAQAPRPATWTIGKELGEIPVAIGIVNAMAKHGPRKDAEVPRTTPNEALDILIMGAISIHAHHRRTLTRAA